MPPHRLKILFADPESDWPRTTALVLEPQGVETIQVRSGREALARIEGGDIHLAVLDNNMPQLGGLQIVKILRESKCSPPAILLARDLNAPLLHEALVMRVFSVLGKPVDVNVLLQTLARAVNRHYAGRWPELASN